MGSFLRLLFLTGALIFLVAPVFGADLCSLPANVGTAYIGNPQSLLNCFNSVPFQATQAKTTVEGMRYLINLYSFTDMAANSGAPYNIKMDLRATLNQISAKVNNGAYSNDYQFQADLMNMMNPLFDAHTLYRAPTGYQCFLLRPFNIEASLDQSGSSMIYKLREGPLAANTASIWKNVFNFDPDQYVNKQVTSINNMSPTDHLMNFANSFISTYKDQGVRYNAALRGRWAQVLLSMFPITDPNIEFSTTMTFADGSSIVVPNAAFCGNGGINSTATLLQRNKASSMLKREALDDETVMIKGIDVHEELLTMFEEAAKGIVDPRQPKRDAFVHKVPTSPIVAHNLRPAIETAKTQGIADLHDLKGYQVPERFLPGTFDSSFLTIVSHTASYDTIFMKYNDGVHPVHYVLRLTSFAPAKVPETIAIIQQLIGDAQTNKATHLIVDVANNGGGIICLSDLLLALLVPQWGSLNPGAGGPTVPYGIYDFRQSTASDAIRANSQMNSLFTSYSNYLDRSTEKPYTNASFWNPISRTRGGLTSNYTQQAYFPAQCVGYNGGVAGFKPIPYYFKAITVLTDGTCGSACALFASQLQSENLARVVSYGGPIRRSIPLSTASFAGGNVLEYGTVALYGYFSGGSGLPPMLTSSAAARFNFNEYYEIIDLDTPREFLKRPADIHLDFWATLYNDKVQTPLGLANTAALYAAVVSQ